MKIVILDGYIKNPGDLSWSRYEELGDLTIYDRTQAEDTKLIIERIGDAEAVLVSSVPLNREVIENCTTIRYIGVLSTGYDGVDIKAARERNIPVCNIPTYGTNSVGVSFVRAGRMNRMKFISISYLALILGIS